MDEMKVVTSGRSFLDIDAYAGCVAYAELLNLQGHEAVAFSSAAINESVTETIRSWSAPLSTTYAPTEEDTFVLVDVCEPEYLDHVVVIDRVEEVIDHHVGQEAFWEQRIGSKATIEFIGAACTQVYEKWVTAGRFDEMSELSARLLICGILDNTLNFKAQITTDRDQAAYDHLLTKAHLTKYWTAQYFQDCEMSIFADIHTALINDTKYVTFKHLAIDQVAFGQLVIWDAKRATGEYRGQVEATMASKSASWFVNVVSISDGKSFFIASDDKVLNWAETILGVRFDNRLAVAGRLWLRKEIIKQDLTTE